MGITDTRFMCDYGDLSNMPIVQAWAVMECKEGKVDVARQLFEAGSRADPHHLHIWQVRPPGACHLFPPICQSMAQMQLDLLPRHASSSAGSQCVRECMFWCGQPSKPGRAAVRTLCSAARPQASRRMLACLHGEPRGESGCGGKDTA